MHVRDTWSFSAISRVVLWRSESIALIRSSSTSTGRKWNSQLLSCQPNIMPLEHGGEGFQRFHHDLSRNSRSSAWFSILRKLGLLRSKRSARSSCFFFPAHKGRSPSWEYLKRETRIENRGEIRGARFNPAFLSRVCRERRDSKGFLSGHLGPCESPTIRKSTRRRSAFQYVVYTREKEGNVYSNERNGVKGLGGI